MLEPPTPPAVVPEREASTLLRFLGLHLALGAAFGVAIASTIIMADVAGLHGLLAETQQPAIAIALFYVFNALTFGSVCMGIGIMTLPFDESCDMRDPDDWGPR